MANAIKGEVPFELGDKPYVLSLSINALCEAEALTGSTTPVLLMTLGQGSYASARALFWAALWDRHKDITLQQAGEIMTALGRKEALTVLGNVVKLAFPELAQDNQGQDASGPLADQTASQPAGTGNAS